MVREALLGEARLELDIGRLVAVDAVHEVSPARNTFMGSGRVQ